jgi:hypothetical protein
MYYIFHFMEYIGFTCLACHCEEVLRRGNPVTIIHHTLYNAYAV